MSNNFFRLFAFRTSPVHRKLLRDLLIVILLTSAVIIGFVYWQGTEIRREISRSLIKQTTDRALEIFQRFFEPVENSLLIAQKWGKARELDIKNSISLNKKFIPILEHLPQVSALIIANSQGGEYFLLRDTTVWQTRSIHQEGGEKRVLWQTWQSADKMIKKRWEESEYDPRLRPWYRGAADSTAEDEIYWSKPYNFYSGQSPGITLSMKWHSQDAPALVNVIAFDVLLNTIVKTVTDLKIGKNGRAFLFRKNGKVFHFPEIEAIKADSLKKRIYLTSAEVLQIPLLSQALEQWKKSEVQNHRAVDFKMNGLTWWGGFKPIDPDNPAVWIGMVVPESDLLQDIPGTRRPQIILISLGILMLGILLSIFLVRKYSRQLREVPPKIIGSNDVENKVKALIKKGEDSELEFKSTMRMNLHTGKPGKEIELAWLKSVAGFMNTSGGTILIGVNDEGKVVGIEPDGFENDDKCRLHFRNLIKQHIGLEFSKFVSSDIKMVSGKKILIVECETATEPVFLRTGKEEAFYIRSGPSSVPLSTSEVLKYLEQRK